MGFAVIRSGELIDWRVQTYKGEWSKDKLEYILRKIEAFCEYHRVTAIALKKVDPSKGSRQLEVLTAHITKLAQKKRLSIATYSIHDLREISGDRYRSAKKSIADYTLDMHPELQREYIKERNNRRAYYAKMFEAVLCAHISNIKEREV